ncbi:hypothetical protein AGDE_09197, partial [Angomonas deanei]
MFGENLKEEYHFGTPDPSTVNRPAGNTSGEEAMPTYNFGGMSTNNREEPSSFYPGDIEVNNDSSFSPKENAGETGGAGGFMPADFGQMEGGAVASTNNQTYDKSKSKKDKKKEEGGKKQVVKDVLGIGKKSTKGMSEEEKSQVDLERRWKNALAEEQRLNKLSEKVQMQAGESTEPPDNFPPKFLCIRPFMYHSMDAVMPERRKFVTMCFWEWVAVSIALIYNMIAVIITIALPDREDAVIKRNVNKPAQIVLSIVFVIGIPISFFTWYWRIYRACCTRNPAQHFVALCSLILDLGWFVFVLIGPLSCGVCGIIYTIYVSE